MLLQGDKNHIVVFITIRSVDNRQETIEYKADLQIAVEKTRFSN